MSNKNEQLQKLSNSGSLNHSNDKCYIYSWKLGDAYREKGKFDKAIEHYQIALRLNPDNANTHLNLGIAYKEKGWANKSLELSKYSKKAKSNLI